jgi:hypothetical protein
MIRHRYAITDDSGRVAEIRIVIPGSAAASLRRFYAGDESAMSNFSCHWEALTFGAFGAQLGALRIIPNPSEVNYFHVILSAVMSGGRFRDLMVLKDWFTDYRYGVVGSGTLLCGVNSGLHAGEMNWARQRRPGQR